MGLEVFRRLRRSERIIPYKISRSLFPLFSAHKLKMLCSAVKYCFYHLSLLFPEELMFCLPVKDYQYFCKSLLFHYSSPKPED